MLGLLLLLPGATPGAGQTLAYEGSLSLTTGTYLFSERTTSLGLTTGLALGAGPVTFRVSLPVWLQNSTVVSASVPGLPGTGVPTGPGSGGAPTGGSSSGTVGDSGRGKGGRGGGGGSGMLYSRVDVPASSFTDYQFAMGDPLGSLSLRLLQTGRVSFSVTGLAKAPVADTSGFGTGEWDLGIAAGSTLGLGGRTLLGLDAAWWRLGDMPGLDFRNPVSGTLSLTHLVRSGWGLTLFASGSTAAIEGFDPPVMVGGGFARIREGSAWGLQAGAGLTETTADLSLALYWRLGI